MQDDEQYMKKCLELAGKGFGYVFPNPMVGCVIVYNNKVIGSGYHEKFGGPHAEVNAIKSVPGEFQHFFPQSTLYVNLEPCAHQGKTPPCADMLVYEKFARVVIGSLDPNPLVSGRGIEKLKSAGIEVKTEVLKEESDFLNRRFITFHTKNRPYIILKWAESADGFMALDKPKQIWLTGEESRKLVHQWRSEEQGILVGRNTVEIDDPALTARLVTGKNPVRLILDQYLTLGFDKKIFRDDADVYIYNEKIDDVDGTVHNVKIDFAGDVLAQIMKHLYSIDIQSIIVEGGPTTLKRFVEQDLWDEARVFTSTTLLKDGKKSPEFNGILKHEEMVGEDTLKIFYRV
jgi:diaminohydroxyphosphoribosylaminopyrimidine deaminase/5-amino-6-(5-phosphoribosylamino)uracil reductase